MLSVRSAHQLSYRSWGTSYKKPILRIFCTVLHEYLNAKSSTYMNGTYVIWCRLADFRHADGQTLILQPFRKVALGVAAHRDSALETIQIRLSENLYSGQSCQRISKLLLLSPSSSQKIFRTILDLHHQNARLDDSPILLKISCFLRNQSIRARRATEHAIRGFVR